MDLTIGVDVGGTKIASGVVNNNGEILAMSKRPTPAQDTNGAITAIIDSIEELQANYDVSAIGIGAPGFVNNLRNSVIFAPNVLWRNEPLAQKINEAIGLPVVIENDANAAAWGEYKFGAGKNHQSTVTVTVGTGIGGGIVIENQLLRGAYGFAGEIGHMNMVPNGLPCGCGEKGCWEQYGSGNALVRMAKERALAGSFITNEMLKMANGKIENITGVLVTEAAQKGDPLALDCFAELGQWLGRGMAILSATLDPEIFVISGGVSEAGDLLLSPIRDAFYSTLTARKYRTLPEILPAELSNNAGLIGAANIALH